MIGQTDAFRLPAGLRAELIYAQARSQLSDRLWQAALGENGRDAQPRNADHRAVQGVSLDSLIALLMADETDALRTPRAAQAAKNLPDPVPAQTRPAGAFAGTSAPVAAEGLGANAGFRPALSAAAARTGLPAAALAAIVHAEAAKDAGGRWLAFSRNPRSSAAGLGQFLSGTWKGEAERHGTWLNGVARARGWLAEDGQVRSEARSQLLAMRYDPEASIEAIADYARDNLDRLSAAGVRVRPDVEGVAQAAYLGHHLGIGDAIRFLNGTMEAGRARRRLDAQIGAGAADRKIAASGTAVGAHRAWLLDYVERNIRPSRFASLAASQQDRDRT
jgi:hypothetical protein